jgi:D-alanyl-lipoteichoic acid acyltransferase DltB (MBOAT superfamily)
MVFHSVAFAGFFLPVFLLFWSLRRWRSGRVGFLILASYLFYLGANVRYLGLILCDPGLLFDPTAAIPVGVRYALLIAVQTVSDYFLARGMARSEGPLFRKMLLWLSLAINLGILAFFKYCNFFATSLAEAAQQLFGWHVEPHLWQVALPVGISFYTFQTLSYTLDVYWRKIPPAERFLDYALSVIFFPQLVAGPIVRAAQILPQLEQTPRFDLDRCNSGLLQFLRGLAKKVVLADTLAATLVDPAFGQPHLASGPHLLLALYAYAFQIYADFSGYTDMALGCARMIGYELPVNFNLPYRAADLSDFWRRWHISLSSFLRDYLYIPLGGSKGGKWRTCRNLMLTMLLGGLWHGAAWHFVLWGAYHGLLLVLLHLWRGEGKRAERSQRNLPWCIFLTFHLVCLGWLFFRAGSLAEILLILERIFTWAPGDGSLFLQERGLWVLLIAILSHYLPTGLLEATSRWVTQRSPLTQGALLAVTLAAIDILGTKSHPFIYFQF